MKVVIAGSRNITDYEVVVSAIKTSKFDIHEIVCGGARGVDSLGERYANENNIDVALFRANWDLHGKKAGFIRNVQMVDYADAVIVIWDGISKGTKHTIDISRKCGIPLYIHEVLILKGVNNEKRNTNNWRRSTSDTSDSKSEGLGILDPCF